MTTFEIWRQKPQIHSIGTTFELFVTLRNGQVNKGET